MIATLETLKTEDLHRELSRSGMKSVANDGAAGEFSIYRKIVTAVAEEYRDYGVRQVQILGRCRTKTVAEARLVCMYLMRLVIRATFESIGRFMHRDHSTAINAAKEISGRRLVDPQLNDRLQRLEAKVRP